MPKEIKRQNKREALIEAGIAEISRCGVSDFSLRRVAQRAGVSCAAPARHFGDKHGFIAAVVDYVNAQWAEEQQRILESCGSSTREKLVAFSIGYIRFLVEKPHFRSILTLKDDKLDNTFHISRGKTSSATLDLISQYCKENNLDDKTRIRKQIVIRSFIFGAAIMFINGEMPYTDEVIEIIRQNIDREFDLP